MKIRKKVLLLPVQRRYLWRKVTPFQCLKAPQEGIVLEGIEKLQEDYLIQISSGVKGLIEMFITKITRMPRSVNGDKWRFRIVI